MLDEQQVYRIDHFLGKEATQDLHVLRFANGLFSAMWNREHIESVQIDVPETLGINDRAGFYDATGAVLDMLVTHLFQVAAEVAMEPPASLGAEDLQAAREEVIGCVPAPRPRARSCSASSRATATCRGSRPTSQPDTFVAARLWIDNDALARRAVLPAHRQAAGRVPSRGSASILREPAGPAGREAAADSNVLCVLAVRRRRDRPVAGGQEARPGAGRSRKPRAAIPLAGLDGADPLPPYVRLIHDVIIGDRSLFTRPDGLAAVWKVAAPLLNNPPMPVPYPQGSWGPEQARNLIAPDHWLLGQ